MGKAKSYVQDKAKGALKSATGGKSVLSQVNNTVAGAMTGGLVTANGKGLIQGGNAAESLTGGMVSSKETSLDKVKNLAMSKILNMGGAKPPALPDPDTNKAADQAPPDPYLEEELANAKKRGRASTVLAGLTDMGGGTSSRRSLIGV